MDPHRSLCALMTHTGMTPAETRDMPAVLVAAMLIALHRA